MTNALYIIMPYKQFGVWMFDDARVGLVGEPFIAGADIMLDCLVSHLPDAEKGFRLLFSAAPFPGYRVKLEWLREDTESSGNWYRWTEANLEGWLCPALFHYFPTAPKTIYVRAEPLEKE